MCQTTSTEKWKNLIGPYHFMLEDNFAWQAFPFLVCHAKAQVKLFQWQRCVESRERRFLTKHFVSSFLTFLFLLPCTLWDCFQRSLQVHRSSYLKTHRRRIKRLLSRKHNLNTLLPLHLLNLKTLILDRSAKAGLASSTHHRSVSSMFTHQRRTDNGSIQWTGPWVHRNEASEEVIMQALSLIRTRNSNPTIRSNSLIIHSINSNL